MARTKRTIRSWIDRIITIRKVEQPALQGEILTIANKLGPGLHRSTEHPGVKVVVSHNRNSGGGWQHDWSMIISELQTRYRIPQRVIDDVKARHRTRIFHYVGAPVSVSVQVDRVKNPKRLAA